MKKYLPDTFTFFIILMLGVSATCFYGKRVPNDVPLNEFLNTIGPIGGSLGFLVVISIIVIIGTIIIFLVKKYDSWKNS